MVKRGIGAVVLAIIAALLLGYLLKDKSNARQEIVDMKLPGSPEMTIPSLSDATAKVTDSAATLVDEAKDTASNAGNAVIASASGTSKSLTDGASNVVEAVTDSVSSTASSVTEVAKATVTESSADSSDSSNPGFSFRPPNKNEEQQINTDTASSSAINNGDSATQETIANNNDVVASSQNTEVAVAKKFKPVIESEPKKAVKKVVKKKPALKKAAPKKTVAKKAEPAKPSTSTSSKYAIQLLATSSQSRANKLAKTMNGEGYVSFITQTKSNNKILYRVRVGGHTDRNAALTAQQSMKRRYQKNFFVQNSLVVSQ